MLGLIFLASLGFFYAAARTLRTYQHWVNQADKFERKLKEVKAEIASLETADREHNPEDNTIGVRQLRIDLGRVLANRGRIWTKCEIRKAATDPSGIMEVHVSPESALNAFTDKMLLYGFEEGDDQSPGRYLGEFHVKAIIEKDNELVLLSTTQLVSSLADNVKKSKDSKSPCVFYEMMPTDEHEALANVPDEYKKFVEVDPKKWDSNEYTKDGQPIDAGGRISQDPKDKDNKFKRPLRDYLAIFRACEMYRTLFADRWESARRDLGYLEAAKKEVENQLELAEKEKTQVAKELDRAKAELAAVENLFASRQNMLNIYQTSVQEAISTNLKYAQEIARLQKEAADKIDRRMRSMAQFGPRAN